MSDRPTARIEQGFRFEAAHFLPMVGPDHRCRRIHGHSYKVDVAVRGAVADDTGWVVDFYDVEAAFAPLLATLDHHLLNEVPGLENPTAEHIALWIWERLRPSLPGLVEVVVHETEHSRAVVGARV
jgi:6-pyruvoyltetrahydropterin/6-carboxytetrahydropterin synthase